MADAIDHQTLNICRAILAAVQKNSTPKVATSVADVDFIVDMFDRKDSSDLGGYWATMPTNAPASAPNIVNGSVHESATISTQNYQYYVLYPGAFHYYENGSEVPVGGSGSTGSVHTRLAYPTAYSQANDTATTGRIVYRAKLRSPKVTCEVKFFLPSANKVETASTDMLLPGWDEGYYGDLGKITQQSVSVTSSGAGIFVGGTPNTATGNASTRGASAFVFQLPGGSVEGATIGGKFGAVVSATSGYYTTEKKILDTLSTFDVVVVGGSSRTASYESTALAWTWEVVSQTAGMASAPAVAGTNTLRMVVNGNLYSYYLNGQFIGSETTSAVPEVLRAGMNIPYLNTLAQADNRGIEPFGITSFKCWRSDKQEPPDQSGHGVYNDSAPEGYKVAGPVVYLDKYHTPVKDERGVIIGAAYNPNA